MKKIITTACATLFAVYGYSQTNTFPSSGNVGIGTTSPAAKIDSWPANNSIASFRGNAGESIQVPAFEFQGYNTNWNTGGLLIKTFEDGVANERMRIASNGNVGIGTSSPLSRLSIGINANELDGLTLRDGGVITSMFKYSTLTGENRIGGAASYAYPTLYSGGAERVRVTTEGNVGIGTTEPKGYKLAVAGNVIAESVKVALQGSWPDYDFKPGNKVLSLPEVEKFVQANSHLPDMPSETEVKKEGINLGQMDAKLLKKIEELTLYMIGINKTVADLKQENQTLKAKVAQLEANKKLL